MLLDGEIINSRTSRCQSFAWKYCPDEPIQTGFFFKKAPKANIYMYKELNNRLIGYTMLNFPAETIKNNLDRVRNVVEKNRAIIHITQFTDDSIIRNRGDITALDPNSTKAKFVNANLSSILRRMNKTPLCVVIDTNQAEFFKPCIINYSTFCSSGVREDKRKKLPTNFGLFSTSICEKVLFGTKFPLDFFTCCLNTPVRALMTYMFSNNGVQLLQWYNKESVYKMFDQRAVKFLPGKATDRDTPIGSFNWLLQALLADIIGSTVDDETFKLCFREDTAIGILFRNYILAHKLSKDLHRNTHSIPELPDTSKHSTWNKIFKLADLFLERLILSAPNSLLLALCKYADDTYEANEYKENPFAAEWPFDVEFVKKMMLDELLICRARFKDAVETYHNWKLYRKSCLFKSTEEIYKQQRLRGLFTVLHCIKSPEYRKLSLEILSMATRLDNENIYSLLLHGFSFYLAKLFGSGDITIYPNLIYLAAKVISYDKSTYTMLYNTKLHPGYSFFNTYLQKNIRLEELFYTFQKIDTLDKQQQQPKEKGLEEAIEDIQFCLNKFILQLNTVYYAVYCLREFFRLAKAIDKFEVYNVFFQIAFQLLFSLRKIHLKRDIIKPWLKKLNETYLSFKSRYERIQQMIQRECLLLIFFLCKAQMTLQLQLSVDNNLRLVCELQESCSSPDVRNSVYVLFTVFEDIWEKEDMLADVLLFYLFGQYQREALFEMRFNVLKAISCIIQSSNILFATENDEVVERLYILLSAACKDVSMKVREFAKKLTAFVDNAIGIPDTLKEKYFPEFTTYQLDIVYIEFEADKFVEHYLANVEKKFQVPYLPQEEPIWLTDPIDEFLWTTYPLHRVRGMCHEIVYNLKHSVQFSDNKTKFSLGVSESCPSSSEIENESIFLDDVTQKQQSICLDLTPKDRAQAFVLTVFVSEAILIRIRPKHSKLLAHVPLKVKRKLFSKHNLVVSFNETGKGSWFSIFHILPLRVLEISDFGITEYEDATILSTYTLRIEGSSIVFFLLSTNLLICLDIHKKRSLIIELTHNKSVEADAPWKLNQVKGELVLESKVATLREPISLESFGAVNKQTNV